MRRYLRAYGPSKPADFAAWAGIAPSHARELWRGVEDELVEVRVAERGRAWLLADDSPALSTPPTTPSAGARLLAPGDPLLQMRDRELLIADDQIRKRLWGAIGNPGLALVDGRPAALWRPRKQGKRLEVKLEPLHGALDDAARDAIAAEAQAVAAQKGAASAALTY